MNNQREETPQEFASRISNPDDIQQYIAQNEEGIEGQLELLHSFEKAKLSYEDIQTSVNTLSDSQTFQPVACLMEAYGFAAVQCKVYGRNMDQVNEQILRLEASNLALKARLKELKSDG